MPRSRLLLAACLLFAVALAAEEITLKDGSKITGKIVSVNDKTFEVESTYGKLQVPRQEVVSISFPENVDKKTAPSESPRRKTVDEKVEGSLYTNRTGMFTLNLPKGWEARPEMIAGDIIAGLGDEMHFAVVLQEKFAGPLQTYKGLFEMQKPRQMTGYQKVSEAETTVDGRPALLISFKGTTAEAQNLPLQFLVGIVQYDGEYVQVLTWSVEPLYDDTRPTFERLIRSYHKLPDSPPPAPKSSPK